MPTTRCRNCGLWLALASLVAGCDLQVATAPGKPAPAPVAVNPPVVEVPESSPPNLVIRENGMLFAGLAPKLGEPLELTIDALRGRWIALRWPGADGESPGSSGVFALTFGSGRRTPWTLSDSGTTVKNPDGDAEIVLNGFRFGLIASAMAWGIDPDQRRGWLASPWVGNPPFEKSLEFQLLRSDLLRVRGKVYLRADVLVEADVLLVRAASDFSSEPIPEISFAPDDFIPVPRDDDPIVGATSAEPYLGTWSAESSGRKTTLRIVDHRLLEISQAVDDDSPVVNRKLTRFNPGENLLEILRQDIAFDVIADLDQRGSEARPGVLRLTQAGRLLYSADDPATAIVFERLPEPADGEK